MVDTLQVAPGIWAWGLMTGVAMVQAGLGVPMAVAMTLLVYGGSAQLAAIPLLAAQVPAWVILATAFCVNLRFAVFSLHLRQYLMPWPRWQRLGIGYFIADLNYVQFVQRHPEPSATAEGRRAEMAYLSGNCFLNWAGWQVASLAGIFMASYIPLEWGLGFAGVLALVSLLSGCMTVTSAMGFVALSRLVLGAKGRCVTPSLDIQVRLPTAPDRFVIVMIRIFAGAVQLTIS